MRRNLLIAQKIRQQFPSASVLVIAGAREAAIFSQQAGIDCLTLPSFRKEPNGTYSSRHLKMSADDVLDFRSETILAAMHNYRPDLFIVDKIPSGAGGELLPTLNWLRSSTNCHCVLGLREILDAADVVRQEGLALSQSRDMNPHLRNRQSRLSNTIQSNALLGIPGKD